jgi:hypothetical protein
MRYLKLLVTPVSDIYSDWRQLFEIPTATGDGCLIRGRGAIDLFLTPPGMKCIQFSVEGKSATAYSPIWRTDKE